MKRLRRQTDFVQGETWVIPHDWEERPVSRFVLDMEKGFPPSRRLTAGNYPYLSVGYLRGDEEPSVFCPPDEGVRVDENDVLLIWDGAANAGEVLRGKKGALGSTLMKLKLNDASDNQFLYAILKFFEDEVKSLRTGTDDRHVDRDALLQFLVPSPQTDERRSIGLLTSWFDRLIENKRRQNRILEAFATMIFRNWFVEYEPFGGEMPMTWGFKPIGEIAKLQNGFPYEGEEKLVSNEEGSYLFLTLNNIIEGGGFKPEYYWIRSDRLGTEDFLEEQDLFMTNVHFGVGGLATGRLFATPALACFPFDYTIRKAVFSMDLTRIVPYVSEFKLFLYHYLKLTREDSLSFSTGTSVLHLDSGNFKKNKAILCPPSPVVREFASKVQPIHQKIQNNLKQILVLKNLVGTLQPLLVFGRLRVEEN